VGLDGAVVAPEVAEMELMAMIVGCEEAAPAAPAAPGRIAAIRQRPSRRTATNDTLPAVGALASGH
jgi:hypothetical protein